MGPFPFEPFFSFFAAMPYEKITKLVNTGHRNEKKPNANRPALKKPPQKEGSRPFPNPQLSTNLERQDKH